MKKWLSKKIRQLSPESILKVTDDLAVVNYAPPSKEEIQQITEYLFFDEDYMVMSNVDQNEFVNYVLELERKIPVLNIDGKGVKGNIRLLFFSEAAKTLFYRREKPLKNLRSVIIDPSNVYLTNRSDAVGQVQARGPKQYMAMIDMVEEFLRIVDQQSLFVEDVGFPKKLKLAKKDAQNIKKHMLRDNPSKFQSEQMATSVPEMTSNFTQLVNQYFYFLESTGQAGDMLMLEDADGVPVHMRKHVLDCFNGLLASVGVETNAIDLYISWPYYLINLQYKSKGRNVIIHEMAHAIDYDNDGLNGVPLQYLAKDMDTSEWQQKWDEQFELAVKGKMNFLDPYALTNRLEFFAVSTEMFFYRNDILQAKAPDLFRLLEMTYGYVPVVKKVSRISSIMSSINVFKLFKTIDSHADDIEKFAA